MTSIAAERAFHYPDLPRSRRLEMAAAGEFDVPAGRHGWAAWPFTDQAVFTAAFDSVTASTGRVPHPAIEADTCPPAVLARTARDLLARTAGPDEALLWVIAGHRNTPRATLARLSRHREGGVRSRVASNPWTPADILERLLTDPSEDTRRTLAGRPDVTDTLLAVLAGDPELRVRSDVAGNARTPARLLSRLARDPSARVRAAAAGNPRMPVRTLRAMTGETAPAVLAAVLRRRDCLTPEIVALAAHHESPAVRAEAAAATTDPDLVYTLLFDPSPLVRRHAHANPRRGSDTQVALALMDQDGY